MNGNSLTPEQKATEKVERVEDNLLERGFANLPHDLKAELLSRKTKEYEEEREKERTQRVGVWKSPEEEQVKNKLPDHLVEPMKLYDEVAKNRPANAPVGTTRVHRNGAVFEAVQKPPSETSEKQNYREWESGEDWKKLTELRRFAALVEESGEDNLNPEDVEKLKEYKECKKILTDKIKWSSRDRLKEENLDIVENTEEFDMRLRSKISQELSDFYFAEYENVKNARREIKKETVLGRVENQVKEKLVSLMNTKIVKGYLGMNKWARLGITTTFFVMGGYALGSAAVGASLTSAAAYGTGRLARGAGSILAGGVARGYAEKKWSEEDLNKEVEAKKNTIEMSVMANVDREQKIKELKEWEENRRKEIRRNKMLVAMGTGVGAGLFASLAEGELDSVPIRKPLSVDTAVPQKALGVDESNIELQNPEGVQELVEDVSILKHKVEPGDSIWSILGKAVEQNKLFEQISGDANVVEAKKTFILNNLISDNKLASGGVLKVGQEVDFTKVFEDKEKIEKLFEKAENMSNSKIENTLRINSWVKQNIGKPLDEKTLAQILDKKEEVITADSIPNSEPDLQAVDLISKQKDLADSITNLSVQEINENIEKTVVPEPKEILAEETESVAASAMGAAAAGKVVNIEDYKNRGIRTMQGDSRKLVAEKVSNDKVDQHLKADINNIYGKKGILGIGKVEGINTNEWKQISEQNAAKIMAFYANPENSDLPKKIIEKLSVSQEDRNLVEYIDFLRNEARSAASGFLGMAGSDVAPYNNETVGEYLRRLGKFIMEHPKVEIPNGTSGMSRAA